MKASIITLAAVTAALTVVAGPGVAHAESRHDHAFGVCGKATGQRPGTTVEHSINTGDRNRTYRLRLPENYDPRHKWPVMLAFHGRGNDAVHTEEFSKLDTLPAIVVYPNGVAGDGGQSWQGAPYATQGVDDLAFTARLLDRVEEDLCVDTARVYAAGKSNGGGFTGLLACRMSDRIAAVAPVAAAFYPGTRESCTPSRPVPVIEFHGTDDPIIPYAGETDRGLPSIPDWIAAWAGRDGCTATPAPRRIKPDVTITRHTGCDGGVEVQHVAIDGGGHTWPGADIESGEGSTTQTIEAHEILWRFVSRYRLGS